MKLATRLIVCSVVLVSARAAWALGPNLAQGRPVSFSAQSSTRPASKAVDGSTSSTLSGNSIAEILPSGSGNAWIQIDLQSVRQVQAIEIYNTTEACAAPGGSCAMDAVSILAAEVSLQSADAAAPRVHVSAAATSVGNQSNNRTCPTSRRTTATVLLRAFDSAIRSRA